MLRRLLLTTGVAIAMAAPTYALGAEHTENSEPESKSQLEQPAGESQREQPASESQLEEKGSASTEEGRIISEQETGHVLVEDLIGMDVVNRQGESLGTVDDVVLDQRGRMAGLVLSTGGFLGVGAKPVGVAWSDLTTALDADVLTLGLTREQVASAPEFKTKKQKESERENREGQKEQQKMREKNSGDVAPESSAE